MGQIVVGVDGSQDSEAALRWAAAEARLRSDSLVILYAVHTPVTAVPFSGGIVLPPTDDLQEYGNGLLGAAAALVEQENPPADVRTELVIQPPVLALLAAARKANLIVLGSRGLSALGAAFLGSVSTRVAARSTCPTVVLRADQRRDDSGPIVVGVDGSPQGDAAIRFALDEAALRHGRVEAVHAYHAPAATLPMEHDETRADIGTPEREAADHRLDTILRRNLDRIPPGLPVNARVSPIDPAEALVSASDGAALTVVGSRGRGAFRGMLLGSVSQRLLQRANSPVAVVHDGGGDDDAGSDLP